MIFREFLSWLGCKINKILSLLAIFVLTMLLSCAFGRVLTKEEVANFMLNAYQTQNGDATSLVSQVENRMATWETIANLTSTYEGKYSMGYNYRTKTFFFVYYTGSTNNLNNQYTTSVMFSSNNAFIGAYYAMSGNQSVTYNYYNYILNTDNLTNSSSGNGSSSITCFGYSNNNTYWIYSDRKLASSSSFGISAGGQRPTGTNLFAENFVTSEVWNFQSAWSGTVNLSGDNTVDYYVVDPSYIYTVLGTLQDSSLCTGAGYEILAFNKSTNTWEVVYDWGEYFTDSNPISNYFSTGDINGIPTSSIKLRSNLVVPDTIISFTFNRGYSESDLSKQIDVAFYVRGSHSVITNGVADYDSTFSDPDYYNDYQYEVDGLVSAAFDDTLNDINDTLQNDDNVPSVINEYFGTSGEVLQKLGYNDYSGDNPYGNIFLTIIDGFRQVLLDDDNVVLSCTIHGQQFVFNSQDFVNPSSVLKVFTTAFTIFITLYTFYFLAFVYLHKLAEGDLFGLRDSVVKGALTIVRFM